MKTLAWQPKMEAYPILILDDHASEWAARIIDDDRIEADYDRMDTACVPVRLRRTRPETDRTAESERAHAAAHYESKRVWAGDVFSGLC